MSGETNLRLLLQSMQPILHTEDYVFCSINRQQVFRLNCEPLCQFREAEGLTLILTRGQADSEALAYASVFRMITLAIHSSLEAVGFLAAITHQLASHGISVNPVSAYYHDHLFVPVAQAETAMMLLQELSAEADTILPGTP
jgi:hypothetical protein